MTADKYIYYWAPRASRVLDSENTIMTLQG